ncbi:peptidylprolyl isomerase [Ramlibacter tataouinensis]|uniref:Chaperone SurA n=1 Tax=Ramlibacter tataouinensis (strain ATCC BAA-407 / DSM 14655 / LMG 21543 / TTB310) TaxID=365046 RepID=F5Y324_RAMTT|nr:peptidylprolyl isomerase [Ramlibacter tataouinensis]AEG94904.1 survival protein surA precursor (chaperone surA)-like protein [Ramlibacter tataouinensis TTB310]
MSLESDLLSPAARVLGLALLALGLAAPAAAQGLRVPPQPGAGGPAAGSAPAASSSPRAADFIVAVVNSEPITNNEVRARLARVEQQLAQQGVAMPPRAELARQVLERLISERAQLQLARELGIRIDEAIIDQAEQNVARQNQLTVAELRRQLEADGISRAAFREDLRNQLLLGRLRDREIEPKVRLSDLDVDQFIREQQQNSADPSSLELNLAHILVAVPENAGDAQVQQLRAKALAVQERARSGADFAALARELSDAPGAGTNGGLVGLRTADRYPPLFVQATQRLPVGGISEVVRSGAGFHVIKVVEKRQGGLPGATVVQSRARHILLRPGPQLSEGAARAQLAEFKRRVEAGQAEFAQLARQHSQDGSARNGGDLGWANPGMFVPEFEETMNTLAPGQIAEPIVSRFGVHLIQLVERRQAQLSQREQRDVARNVLREKKLEEAYTRWAQDVRGRAFVEYREPPQL